MKIRKIVISILMGICVCLASVALLTACEGKKQLTFKTLSLTDERIVYGKVHNEVETFSFIEEIKTRGNVKYIVSFDISGVALATTKIVPLEIGNNVFYVTEMIDDEPTTIYKIVIRRRPTYTVSFQDDNGTIVGELTVEEDSCLEKPNRSGYILKTCDYDFTKPIVEDVVINTSWDISPEMKNFRFTSTFTSSREFCEITDVIDKTIKELDIPNYVTAIGPQAFYNCNSLEKVSIGTSVQTIGEYAFYSCSSLTKIIIPNSVTAIGRYAFSGDSGLTNVIFEDESTWYRTNSRSNWQNKTEGIYIDVGFPADNAECLKSIYCKDYWYKL